MVELMVFRKGLRPKLREILIFGVLLLGLAASLRVVQESQEIRKEAAAVSFTFTVIGDTHAGIQGFPNFHDWANYNHQQAINKMASLSPNFYLHLGDMVQEPTSFAWNEFFNIENLLINSRPIYPTIGNHESYTENKSFYNKFSQYSHLVSPSDPHLVKTMQKSAPWYSFDWGNAHFVSLRIDYDSYYPQGEAGRPGSTQYQWLESDLASTGKPWKVVFFHVQIYSSTSQLSSQRKDMRSYLHPLFKQYGVDLVLGGHDHYYERVEKDGIVYIESGGGDNRWVPPSAIPQRKAVSEKNHIVWIKVDGGTLEAEAISTRAKGNDWTDPGGETLDSFQIIKSIGTTPAPAAFQLFPGWNQIAWSDIPSYTAKTALTDINADCGTGTGLVGARKTKDWWEEYLWGYGGDDFSLISGQNYFIKSSRNCSWSP